MAFSSSITTCGSAWEIMCCLLESLTVWRFDDKLGTGLFFRVFTVDPNLDSDPDADPGRDDAPGLGIVFDFISSAGRALVVLDREDDERDFESSVGLEEDETVDVDLMVGDRGLCN